MLVETCGATDDESNRAQWEVFWGGNGNEYRFIGHLGFGGKFWRGRHSWYITCYPEDVTPKRQAMMDAAAPRLRTLEEIWRDDAVGSLEG